VNRQFARQAQQLQARLAKAQEQLESTTVDASSGGGVVKVVITGKLKIQSISIDKDVVDPDDIEILEELILAAINEGLDKAQESAQQMMGAITGGLKLPGL